MNVRTVLRINRTVMLGWAIGLFVYMLMIGASFAAIKDNEQYDQLWEELPEGIRDAFGGSDSLTSVKGYLESQATSLLPILLGIFVVMNVAKFLSGAEERGQLDHVFGRSLSRSEYLTNVALATLLGQVGILMSATLGALAGFALAGTGGLDLVRIVLAMAELLPIILVHAAVGLLAGTLFHRKGGSTGLGVGVVISGFAFQVLSGATGWKWMQNMSLFGMWGKSNGFYGDPSWAYIATSLLAIPLVVAAYWQFERKDLY